MEKQENIFQFINEKSLQNSSKWTLDPFPHFVIDNFLQQEVFDRITNDLTVSPKSEVIQRQFDTYIESKKKIYYDQALSNTAAIPIGVLESNLIKGLISEFLNHSDVISMSEQYLYGGYSPYHEMESGGVLGSHVDHCFSQDNKYLHVANAIFYASNLWQPDWGGETILFSRNGIKPTRLIEFKPNRLILFIHSSNSFHGVNYISSPPEQKRKSYYMDYYCLPEKNRNIEKILKSKGCHGLRYTHHSTTFLPFFPIGLKSFRIKNLFRIKSFSYAFYYVIYYISRITRHNFLVYFKRLKRFTQMILSKE